MAKCEMTVTLTDRARDLAALAEAVDAFVEKAGWGEAIGFRVKLILEELATNAFDYGFPDGRPVAVEVKLSRDETTALLQITDSGIAWNPLEQPEPNLDLPLEDRPIGGLGIHLARVYSNEAVYRRQDDRNVLTLRIDLTQQPDNTD